MLQLPQFYLENKGKYILEAWRYADPKDMKRRARERERQKERESETESTCTQERETPGPLAPLFKCFFPPPGPALCKLGQPGVLFVVPKVLTPVLGSSFDLPLFYFRGLFPSLSFSHCHSGLLFPILVRARPRESHACTFTAQKHGLIQVQIGRAHV